MRKRCAAWKSLSLAALLSLRRCFATLVPSPFSGLGLSCLVGWWSVHTDPYSDTECKFISVARATRCRTCRRIALLNHAPWPRLAAGAMASDRRQSESDFSHREKSARRLFRAQRQTNTNTRSLTDSHAREGVISHIDVVDPLAWFAIALEARDALKARAL